MLPLDCIGYSTNLFTWWLSHFWRGALTWITHSFSLQGTYSGLWKWQKDMQEASPTIASITTTTKTKSVFSTACTYKILRMVMLVTDSRFSLPRDHELFPNRGMLCSSCTHPRISSSTVGACWKHQSTGLKKVGTCQPESSDFLYALPFLSHVGRLMVFWTGEEAWTSNLHSNPRWKKVPYPQSPRIHGSVSCPLGSTFSFQQARIAA